MSKRPDDFFKVKKPWSVIKDDMLGNYLTPYLSKILTNKRPLNYFDCFAGKGLFDDGSLGSPLIALNAIDQAISRTKACSPIVRTFFIDSNFALDLKVNLEGRNYTQIIDGRYEEHIGRLLKNIGNENVFLYIDPCGVKDLNMNWLNSLIQSGFNSLEILLNFNSSGFMRLACSCLGVSYLEGDPDDVFDFETYLSFNNRKKSAVLYQIAGGDYWEKIILDFKEKRIDWKEAELSLSRLFCSELRKKYKYVLDLPIRVKENQTTKYRMVFATKNAEGCVLMARTIFKQKEHLGLLQRAGQLTFLNETLDFEPVDLEDSRTRLLGYINSLTQRERLCEVFANYYTINGLKCNPTVITEFIREFEDKGLIQVTRDPNLSKTGKIRKFYTESKFQKIWLFKRMMYE